MPASLKKDRGTRFSVVGTAHPLRHPRKGLNMRPPQEQPNQNPPSQDPTLIALRRFVLLLSISLLIAAMAPHFASALSTFLFIAAVIAAAMAIRQSEKLALEHLTDWDVSAALMALSLLARIFAKE